MHLKVISMFTNTIYLDYHLLPNKSVLHVNCIFSLVKQISHTIFFLTFKTDLLNQ